MLTTVYKHCSPYKLITCFCYANQSTQHYHNLILKIQLKVIKCLPVKDFKLSLSIKNMMRTQRVIANTTTARTKALVMQPINNLQMNIQKMLLTTLKCFFQTICKPYSIYANSPGLSRSILETDRISHSPIRVTKSPRP